MTTSLVPGFAYGWRIRAFIETENLEAIEWSSIENCTEQSYSLTGLTAGKDYMVQVRGNYGNENYSEWERATFSTSEEVVLPEPDPDGLKSVVMDTEATSAWYSLDGRRLNGKPTKKGLYIRNNRKIVVK